MMIMPLIIVYISKANGIFLTTSEGYSLYPLSLSIFGLLLSGLIMLTITSYMSTPEKP